MLEKQLLELTNRYNAALPYKDYTNADLKDMEFWLEHVKEFYNGNSDNSWLEHFAEILNRVEQELIRVEADIAAIIPLLARAEDDLPADVEASMLVRGMWVSTRIIAPGGRVVQLAPGSVGVIDEYDPKERLFWVAFELPFKDVDGATWLRDDDDPERRWIRVGYKAQELRLCKKAVAQARVSKVLNKTDKRRLKARLSRAATLGEVWQ